MARKFQIPPGSKGLMETNLNRPLPRSTFSQHYISSKFGYTRRKAMNILLLCTDGCLNIAGSYSIILDHWICDLQGEFIYQPGFIHTDAASHGYDRGWSAPCD